MALMEIDTVGAVGLIKDLLPYTLDTAAWSTARNIRFVDEVVESMAGRSSAFGTLSDVPQFVMAMATGTENLWLWASFRKIWKWDSTSHVDITGPSGPYSAQRAANWNGHIFNGFAILNNGFDLPQYWVAGNPTALDLPNWPETHRARVIRALGARLVAIYITKDGTPYPHMLRWSQPADPGTLPTSWDESDPTKTVGETEFPDVSSGVLQDMLSLRGQMYIYKDTATWRMRLAGGEEIFAFDTFLDTSGVLCPRAVALTGDGLRHFVVTQDDVIVHDGITATPVFSKKYRKYLFSQMSTDYYADTFCFSHPKKKEMWLCYVGQGSLIPNLAVVWNYETQTISEVEIDFSAAGTGLYQVPDTETWATVVGTWATITRRWSQSVSEAVLVAAPTKVLRLEVGNTFDGVNPTVTLQRTGLSLQGKKRSGGPIGDYTQRMLVVRVWPRLHGSGPVSIRIGGQDNPEDTIRWTDQAIFTPGTQKFVDLITEGGLIALELQTSADVSWRLEGYKLDGNRTGQY